MALSQLVSNVISVSGSCWRSVSYCFYLISSFSRLRVHSFSVHVYLASILRGPSIHFVIQQWVATLYFNLLLSLTPSEGRPSTRIQHNLRQTGVWFEYNTKSVSDEHNIVIRSTQQVQRTPHGSQLHK
jgi:hypothetical protein